MSATVLVVNPTAGGGRGERVWSRLLAARPELAAHSLVAEPDPGRATARLEELLAGPVERVLAVGGDGTAHMVANRVLQAGRGAEVAVGLIPAGTGSDLARSLGVPADPESALEIALGESRREVDAVEVLTAAGERRFIVNVLSLGVSGVVVEVLNRAGKKGGAAYLRGAVAAFRSYRPVRCRIEVDGEPWFDDEILLLALANSKTFGKGMRIAPRAELDDGLVDVVAVRPAPFLRFLLQLPRLYLGDLLASPLVTWCQARNVRFVPAGVLPAFDYDGEDHPPGPFTAQVVPRALRFLV